MPGFSFWEARKKLPELRREIVQAPREEVYDLDWLNEVKSKVYTDGSRGEMLTSNVLGTLLLKVEKSNKLLSNFRPSPFKVVQKIGIEVQSEMRHL